MPYISQPRRDRLNGIGAHRQGALARNPGELNYLITELCLGYSRKSESDLRYQDINDILGALEGAKLEFYARLARPHEDSKIIENGDVY